MGTIIDMGVDLQIIDKKGTWFSYKTQRLGQGREAVRDELKKNPALATEIEKQILEKYKEKGGSLPVSSRSDEVGEIVNQLKE